MEDSLLGAMTAPQLLLPADLQDVSLSRRAGQRVAG